MPDSKVLMQAQVVEAYTSGAMPCSPDSTCAQEDFSIGITTDSSLQCNIYFHFACSLAVNMLLEVQAREPKHQKRYSLCTRGHFLLLVQYFVDLPFLLFLAFVYHSSLTSPGISCLLGGLLLASIVQFLSGTADLPP